MTLPIIIFILQKTFIITQYFCPGVVSYISDPAFLKLITNPSQELMELRRECSSVTKSKSRKIAMADEFSVQLNEALTR